MKANLISAGQSVASWLLRPWVKRVIGCTLVVYLGFFVLEGLINLLSHLPPYPLSFDPVILALFRVERVILAPRSGLRALWPGEMTPGWLNVLTAGLNFLSWGAVVALVRRFWKRA